MSSSRPSLRHVAAAISFVVAAVAGGTAPAGQPSAPASASSHSRDGDPSHAAMTQHARDGDPSHAPMTQHARGDDPSHAAMMQLAVEHWLRTQAPDGTLPYGYDFGIDAAADPDAPWKYVVRQAIGLQVLAEYYRHAADARLREPVRRALEALRAHSLPIAKSPLQRALESMRVLSLPVARWKLRATLDRTGLLYRPEGDGKIVSPDGRYESALTGATALALLAAVAWSEAAHDASFDDLRAAWLRGVMDMRIPGRGFRQSPASIDEDDFSNGEAWLALAVYADRHRDATAIHAMLEDLDAVMLARYAGVASWGFHHWGAMAAAQRFRTTDDPRFLDFLEAQTIVFQDRMVPRHLPGANTCADMEGAAATLASLALGGRGATPRAQRLREWLGSQADGLPRLQLQAGQVQVPLGGDAVLHAPRLAGFAGSFLLGMQDLSTRVDTDAHCVSALMQLGQHGVLASPRAGGMPAGAITPRQ